MRWQFMGLGVTGCLLLGACDDDGGPRPTGNVVDTQTNDDDDGDVSSSTTEAPTTDTANPTTGPSTDPTTDPGPSTDPTTDPTTGVTTETSGDDADTGDTSSQMCVGATANITQIGNVIASSVFDTLFGPAYEADLAIDGDVATSWFSEGPEVDGTESTFEWYTQQDHCIDEIAIISNANNANPDFREGFGFESGLLEILDTSGAVVFSEPLDLAGTPDPDIVVDPGGVLGNQVRLTLMGHESEDCGGFAELAIDGRAQP